MAAEENRTGKVARSALIVMAGWGFSVVVGLVRQQVYFAEFGTTFATDAFTAANVIPELLFTMLSGGALSFAFIPVYTEFLIGEKDGNPNELVSQVINLAFLLVTGISILAAIAAPALVTGRFGVGPGFNAETQALTVQLMRILLASTVIFAISSILTATLYAHQHFIVPALVPSLYSAGIIFGIVVLGPQIGIFGAAWGAVIGSLLHFGVQVPAVLFYKVRWKPVLRISDKALQTVAILMAPRVIDLLMARASIEFLAANLVSGLGEGRLTALRSAFTLMNIPWTLIGTSIGIAIFPTLAELAARKDLNAQRQAMSGALRAILTLAIPAAAGLLLLGEPLIRLLFERGEFTAESTQLVYYALQFYVVALLSQSVLEVVVRSFAAQQDTYTPLYVSVFTTAINVGLAIWLTRPALLSHAGPALANGIAVGIEALIGLTILSIRWKGINAGQILLDAGKALLAAALMSATILGVRMLVGDSDLMLILVGGGIGTVVYFVAALAMGIREIVEIPAAMLRRVQPAEA